VLLAVADQPSPSVQVGHLLTAWQFGEWFALLAFIVHVAAVVWYLGAVLRLRHRGRSWSRWRTAAFVSGVFVLDVAVVSGLASYDDQVFTVHVVQHLLLMMVAPPLLALGAPITLAIQSARRPLQSRLIHVLHHPVLRVVTLPAVAGVLYYASMYAFFLTSFYPFSLRHPLVHDAGHVVMFVIGCLFWWPMVAVDQLPHRPAFSTRIIAMFVGMPFEVFLGLALLNQGSPIAPEHTLSDTHTGGAVFWGASMIITFGAALLMLHQWMSQEERASARRDRRPSAREARRLQMWEAAWGAKGPPVPASGPATGSDGGDEEP
jgi:putative copper resistance protein D